MYALLPIPAPTDTWMGLYRDHTAVNTAMGVRGGSQVSPGTTDFVSIKYEIGREVSG